MNSEHRRPLATIAVVAVGILILGSLLSACQSSAPSSQSAGASKQGGETVKLGMATDLSGSAALLGVAGVNGVTLAVEDLNAAGGVLGKKIELIVRNTEGRPEAGTREVRDLIQREKVAALMGPVSSAVGLAESAVAKENKVPIFLHTSNTERLTVDLGHPYVFSVVPNTGIEGRAQAIDMAKLPYKTYYIIGPDYEFGHLQANAFKEKMKELRPDVQFVGEQWPKLGETNYQSFITAILAAKPEAVYSNLWGGDLVGFTKQAKGYGFFEKTFFTALYDVEVLSTLGSDTPNGVRGFSRAPFYAIDNPKIAPWVEKYRNRFGIYPSDWPIMAYDAVNLWAAGVKKANTFEADAVVKALEGYKFDSLRGPLNIRAADHQGDVASYMGEVGSTDKYPFPIYKSVRAVAGDKAWMPEGDIAKLRANPRQ